MTLTVLSLWWLLILIKCYFVLMMLIVHFYIFFQNDTVLRHLASIYKPKYQRKTSPTWSHYRNADLAFELQCIIENEVISTKDIGIVWTWFCRIQRMSLCVWVRGFPWVNIAYMELKENQNYVMFFNPDVICNYFN